jgi:hypothetical protein
MHNFPDALKNPQETGDGQLRHGIAAGITIVHITRNFVSRAGRAWRPAWRNSPAGLFRIGFCTLLWTR